jgi:hypothetical protein
MQKETLIKFLDDLSASLKNNELTEKQIQDIGEFHMSYKYNDYKTKNEVEDKNLQKYLSAGWYIYNIILNTE